MSDIAIKVNNISKRYRIGLKEELHDTFFEAATSWIKSPITNFRLLQKLSKFNEDEESEDIIWALRDVSFEVKKGEVLGIIGKNGAGKSTLLKILCRITEPTSGNASIHGRVASLLEVGTGFHQELTGRENIFLNGSILGMTTVEIMKKFDEIVEFSGVEKYIDTPVKRYSSGMRVRLAFSVAGHLDPEILLIDEVLAVGDYDFQQKCLNKMDEVSHEGRTVLIVSHNMSSITQLCKSAILLNSGKIDSVGNAKDIVSEYIRKGSSSTGEMIWSNLESAPGDNILKLHSARILSSDNEVVSEIDIEKEFLIEIKYWNLKNGAKMWVGIHLFNELDIHVFGSANNPIDSTQPDVLWNTPQPEGMYKTICRIPGRLLNEGIYSVSVAIGINTLNVIAHEKRILTFTIYDTISTIQKREKKSGGIIRPRLGWETDRI